MSLKMLTSCRCLVPLGILLLLASTSPWASELRVSGASTIYPILEALGGDYQQGTGTPLVLSAGGSGRGIADVRAGNSDLGMVSRALRESEKADLQYATIGLDTLVFVVNAENPLTNITKNQLASLYTEQLDWQGLNDYPWPLRLVSKEVGRSTLDLFEEYSGLRSPDRPAASGQLISSKATVIGANLEALTLVGGQRGAIGYVSLGTAASLRDQGLPIRILSLDGVEASAATILNARYPIRRELNLVYREMTPAIEALLTILATAKGRSVVEQAGFIASGGQ